MAEIIFTAATGADSELRYTPAGRPVLNFRACDSKSKKLDNGTWETISENWFNVTIWGDTAEYLAERILKGTRLKIYGEFYQRPYEGKNGPGISFDVRASAVEILTQREAKPASNGTWTPQQNSTSTPTADPWATSAPATSEPPF
ncbi:MAG: single-stranded DNA-binding protein [Renibacterium salmoninarum]|jgi:single-strand DNA-binding protein|nr:single-stranded DNA-binding protein [Renibacterium salmoninarum]